MLPPLSPSRPNNMAATVPPSFGHATAQKDGIARQRSMSAGDLPRLDTASAVARCRVRYGASGARFHDVKLLPLRAASAREARDAARLRFCLLTVSLKICAAFHRRRTRGKYVLCHAARLRALAA